MRFIVNGLKIVINNGECRKSDEESKRNEITMNPTFYVIKGDKNSGKTTTCWKLLMLLKRLKSRVICYNYWELITFRHDVTYNKEEKYYELPKLKRQQRNIVDFFAIIHLDTTNPNSKVAIISVGEDPFYIKKAIYKALGENAHYIVCCEHVENEPETINWILHEEFGITEHNEYLLKAPQEDLEKKVADKIYKQLKKDLKL